MPEMPAPEVREVTAHSIPGGLALLLGLVGVLVGIGGIVVRRRIRVRRATWRWARRCSSSASCSSSAPFFAMCGLNMVAPGEARVVQLFGRYRGTIRTDGLRWVNPLTCRTKISTRVRNHETAVLKVNDAYGNPIELAAVVVWKVEDTAQAMFEVDDFLEFVATQTEAAVRHIAIEYPYDAHEEDGLSLRGNAEEITEKLAVELHARVEAAGVQIIESRFTHLAYAPEIASAMLQRQQAGAVVAARRQIVDGAVRHGRGGAHPDRRAGHRRAGRGAEGGDGVSNLLVVLCGDRAPQPVLNTGTLYQ